MSSSSIEVRAFRRSDREQLTRLVNAHVAAVIPGVTVSTNAVLSQLEREPAEFIVDPWVAERATLVAEQRGRVVAAAHLLRYAADDRVGEAYRDLGEIRWCLFWPAAPFWPDAEAAAERLMRACLAQLDRWGVARQAVDGALPAPGVYGVPEQWPHVRALYQRAGFVQTGPTEIIWLATLDDLPRPAAPPLPGLRLQRSVGTSGTRLGAVLDEAVLGFVEVETREDAGRLPQHDGWADIGNLEVGETHRRQGLGTWLVGQAADWLRLGRIERVLNYTSPEEAACGAFLAHVGFRELTRTARGWSRPPGPA